MNTVQSDPSKFYRTQLLDNQNLLIWIKKRALLLSLSRLLVFGVMILSLVYSGGNNAIIMLSLGIGMAGFLFLVSKSQDNRQRRKKIETLIQINQNELKGIEGDYSGYPSGDEFISPDHYYNQDIDLFGQGSLFQLANRTELKKGTKKLADLFNSNDISEIEEKQIAIKELSAKAQWRQDYKVNASLLEVDIESNQVVDWLSDYKSVIPVQFKYISLVFGIISILGFVLFGLSIIAWPILLLWFFIGIGITGVYYKKISHLYNTIGKLKNLFVQYATLLDLIENEMFKSTLLKNQQERIKTNGLKASEIFHNLSRELNSLDQRNNFIFSPLAQGFFLWDIKYTQRIENWISTFEETVEHWFDAVEYFDAYNSLANYTFNHPEYIYPEIDNKASKVIDGKDLGHPLLKAESRVSNDFSINKEGFIIITGANMAGKSTFLRTISLNIVMSNVGLPVCASSMKYAPIKLVSSMRTSDSLQNDESYFFSELKRLKFIVDEIKKETYFIVLDEILKGTNSKDKQEGSKKFVEKLVASKSTGIIATHDLSLCELSEDLKQIENYYFDAEIIQDELHFDYKFKKGICKNMNASFLLKKMEIVDH